MASRPTLSELFDRFVWKRGQVNKINQTADKNGLVITPSGPPMCEVCAHNNGDFTCEAFPGGIPIEISGKKRIDHRFPFPGDAGIQFEKDNTKGAFVTQVLTQYSG